MIFRSNLTCPDLTPHFKHLHSRVMAHSMGHDVPSDWADKADDDPVFGIYKRCGFWTHDEAAILYNAARRSGIAVWADIGCHSGWTTAHIAAAGQTVYAVDPMLDVEEFHERYLDNLFGQDHEYCDQDIGSPSIYGVEAMTFPETSTEFFQGQLEMWSEEDGTDYFNGFCIDGDHDPPHPLEDAQNAAAHLADTGVIIFHDFIGAPVREAVTWLLDHGFKARIYWTPHVIACCWRGDFIPPEHVPDPAVVEKLQAHVEQWTDFDLSRVE